MSGYNNVKIGACRGVYHPREDSELLADAVEKYAYGRVLDMGTGSGIQGIIAARKGCDVTFSDTDPLALRCAEANSAANGVKGKFIESDLFSGIHGSFDTIIFNPPYLPSDSFTETALDGGRDGRHYIKRFIDSYNGFVNPRHVVLLLESSLNNYPADVDLLNSEIVSRRVFPFEELVVLKF